MTEKSRTINQWYVSFEKGKDFDSWGQLVEAAEEYSRYHIRTICLFYLLSSFICSTHILLRNSQRSHRKQRRLSKLLYGQLRQWILAWIGRIFKVIQCCMKRYCFDSCLRNKFKPSEFESGLIFPENIFNFLVKILVQSFFNHFQYKWLKLPKKFPKRR